MKSRILYDGSFCWLLKKCLISLAKVEYLGLLNPGRQFFSGDFVPLDCQLKTANSTFASAMPKMHQDNDHRKRQKLWGVYLFFIGLFGFASGIGIATLCSLFNSGSARRDGTFFSFILVVLSTVVLAIGIFKIRSRDSR